MAAAQSAPDAANAPREASAAPPASAGRLSFSLVGALFLASGSTGLLYEVAFAKFLATVFGATAFAVSTVLAAFMGGLALGAHLAGRFGARVRRPVVAYGALEILVGATAAATPALFAAITAAYVPLARAAPGSLATLTFVRGAMTALVVVVPTVAMGATLPLLSRAVAGRRDAEGPVDPAAGRRLALLYAINTAGGATGALASAYAVLPWLGIRGTMYAAAAVNLAIGVAAIAHGRGLEAPAGATHEAAPQNGARSDRALWIIAMASGFLVFAAEVVQTHLLAVLIGNSAYAFGLMLATFLVCLAIGAARVPAFARRHGNGALPLGLALAGLFAALAIPMWDQLPRVFVAAGKVVHGWAPRELVRAAAAFAILVLPTVWMGTTFPLLLEHVASSADVHRKVGRLTAVNTLGTIAGSVLTGYVVLPRLGSQGSLRAVAICFALVAAAAAVSSRAATEASRRSGRWALALAGAAALLAVVVPRWDLARLTSGANVYFTTGPPPDEIVFVREDVHGGVTTVARRAGVTTMYTNGKFQGDDGAEMAAQRRFAHFPSLFVERERHALVVGLGTGTTLGAVAAYPYERIDVAEISPAIVDAARGFFRGPSRGALDDPRVALSLEDGRNLLLVTSAEYDLVTIELTSVWFAGAASLYSHEFYELVRSRLSSGGVLQQWVQLHHIRPRELAAIVRTVRSVFPHVALFVGGEQGILVAKSTPLVASSARLDRMMERPDVVATLGGKTLPDLLGELYAGTPELDQLVAEVGDAPLSTDDNLYLEYATPKGNVLEYRSSLAETIALLERHRLRDPKSRHLGP